MKKVCSSRITIFTESVALLEKLYAQMWLKVLDRNFAMDTNDHDWEDSVIKGLDFDESKCFYTDERKGTNG